MLLKPRIYRVTALSRHVSRVGNGNVAARGNATHSGTDRADNRPLTSSAVPVEFEGGNGSQLSFILPFPVTYEITANAGPTIFSFSFESAAGRTYFIPFSTVFGDITYTIGPGSPQNIGSIFGSGAGTNDNVSLSPFSTGTFSVGDQVVLSAGTLTTNSALGSFSLPLSGDYETFIVAGSTVRISNPGTVPATVPDSLSTLWLALPLAGLFALARLRRFAAQSA